ncbi:lipopolysaccharide biosynthesis protein [Kitasatospora sp. NPDC050543]|uniref:lipopolysaccharide biosynthesis protein n=1 Tax=Kitasatospora sp. NPDC050543 TaxID=3364054 RepID=UPI0037AAF9C6
MIPGLAPRTDASARTCACPEPLPCECSYLSLLRARVRSVRLRHGSEPLLRNGHLLAASAVLAAALGSVFWIFATRWYSAETVGLSYAAISAATLLSALGRFNLGDVLVRFLPAAGRHTRALLLRCYLVSAVFSTLAAGVFLLLVPWIAPGLGFLRTPLVACAFIGMTFGYSLFVLQDGALTGLRRPGWVLGENALFAAAKTVMLMLCAVLAIGSGILVSWSAALVVSIVVTNAVLFRHAVPAHQRADRTGAPAPERVMRYAMADYLGNLSGIAAYSVVPLLVLNQLGAAQNAYYSLAWVIADTLYVAAFSMGSSLVVEAARAPERLGEHARRMLRHTVLLLVCAVAVVVVAAPWILSLFGAAYAANGTTVLRLMALSALPNVLLSVAIDVSRVRRALRWLISLQFAFAILVVVLVAVLLPLLGLPGVGLAWLLASSALGVPLLLTLPRWLPAPKRAPAADGTAPDGTVLDGTAPDPAPADPAAVEGIPPERRA